LSGLVFVFVLFVVFVVLFFGVLVGVCECLFGLFVCGIGFEEVFVLVFVDDLFDLVGVCVEVVFVYGVILLFVVVMCICWVVFRLVVMFLILVSIFFGG